MEKKSGLTLIELIITIALVSILSLAGFGAYRGSQQRGRDALRKGDLKEVRTALRMYCNDHQQFPDDDGSGNISEGCMDGPCTWGSSFFGIRGGTVYMRQLPNDPLSDKGTIQYYYERNDADDNKFNLYACLENSEDEQGTAICSGWCDPSFCFRIQEE